MPKFIPQDAAGRYELLKAASEHAFVLMGNLGTLAEAFPNNVLWHELESRAQEIWKPLNAQVHAIETAIDEVITRDLSS